MNAASFLALCGPDEVCVVVVPTRRMSIAAIVAVLDRNGIQVRLIGRGSCTVMDDAGDRMRFSGIGLVAADKQRWALLNKTMNLCGVSTLLVKM